MIPNLAVFRQFKNIQI